MSVVAIIISIVALLKPELLAAFGFTTGTGAPNAWFWWFVSLLGAMIVLIILGRVLAYVASSDAVDRHFLRREARRQARGGTEEDRPA